jgi:hypothetical protein
MAKAPIVKRKRGRPPKEDSTAIATERAILDYKLKIAMLLPDAVTTLQGLLTTGTEKVKQTTAIFIVNEAKEVYSGYIEEDNETNAAGGTASASSETHADQQSAEMRNLMPLTTEIREYKMAEGED